MRVVTRGGRTRVIAMAMLQPTNPVSTAATARCPACDRRDGWIPRAPAAEGINTVCRVELVTNQATDVK